MAQLNAAKMQMISSSAVVICASRQGILELVVKQRHAGH
jgi:hypothetical protein